MYVFFVLWLVLVWTLWQPTRKDLSHVQVHSPTFRRECFENNVPCVDDCSFLCVERDVQCVGGTCRIQRQAEIPCRTDRGGMRVMVNEPSPHWICLCTNSAFFSGDDCGTLNGDVCEHGVFLYTDRENNECLCPEPYKRVTLRGKPHCLQKHLATFLAENGQGRLQGPSIG